MLETILLFTKELPSFLRFSGYRFLSWSTPWLISLDLPTSHAGSPIPTSFTVVRKALHVNWVQPILK